MKQFYEIQVSVSINKIVLEHGHAHSFVLSMAAFDLFSQKLYCSQSQNYLLFVPLQERFTDFCS